jgi:hypothetical protein
LLLFRSRSRSTWREIQVNVRSGLSPDELAVVFQFSDNAPITFRLGAGVFVELTLEMEFARHLKQN